MLKGRIDRVIRPGVAYEFLADDAWAGWMMLPARLRGISRYNPVVSARSRGDL